MSDHRELINDIIRRISTGDIAPDKAWSTIRSLKDKYIETCEKLHPDKRTQSSPGTPSLEIRSRIWSMQF